VMTPAATRGGAHIMSMGTDHRTSCFISRPTGRCPPFCVTWPSWTWKTDRSTQHATFATSRQLEYCYSFTTAVRVVFFSLIRPSQTSHRRI